MDDFGVLAEVDEQAKFETCGLKVVVYLRAMLIREPADRLDFENDFAEADEIRLIQSLKIVALIFQLQQLLIDKGDQLVMEFESKCFLVDGLEKPISQLVIDLEAGPDDVKAFFLKNNLIRAIRLIRGF